MAPSQARAEQDYYYCRSIQNRCSDDGHKLHVMLEHFINTVRANSRICYPNSLDTRKGVWKCMRDIRDLPGFFPDDFTLNQTDASLGTSMVQFIGEAMEDLRVKFPSVANKPEVTTSYWDLCELLRCKFTLGFDRDGSKREVDPDLWDARVDAEYWLEHLQPRASIYHLSLLVKSYRRSLREVPQSFAMIRRL
jgi:hypothetical protein